ncbi:MAG: glycoside hydrolase family 3 C-terminal domain-containing protein, partial [Clostridia bacterium]
SWDNELIAKVGEHIADEAKQEQVGVVLGPGANIKRSPLCGRNFEYYSEDPYLSGRAAAAFISGIQKSGIGTSLKHYAVNNQEDNRLRINAVVDERALREIYLASFERAVKEGKPYTVMCAYNQINGEYASESKKLLTDILREEWGYEGYVVTDWGATVDRVKGLKNGLDLEMPGGSGESVFEIVNAVAEGKLDIETLNTAVKRLLSVNLKVNSVKTDGYKYDIEAHHRFVRKVAGEGAVLLKNENNTLPFSKDDTVTVIGALFERPRYQGSGSSLIKPNKLVSPKDAFAEAGINFEYAAGYSVISDQPDYNAIDKAVALARESDGKILVFAGLTMFYESEGFDRKHMRLPDNQNLLIQKLIGLHKDITVVLYGGAPTELPWINGVNAVLNMYLPGQAVGESTLDLVFGNVNPSGKLAETYPIKLEDNPSYNYFPEGPLSVEYRESIFVGYRYYDAAKKPVLFPFGYGLSYTTFEYSDISADKTSISMDGEVTVRCKVTNTGKRQGKEVVQLYVRATNSDIIRADKELKGYCKLDLAPNETQTAEFVLDGRAFSFFNVDTNAWEIESGTYEILIGKSSADILLSTKIKGEGVSAKGLYDRERHGEYFSFNGKVSDAAFTEILGYTPPAKYYEIKPIRWETTPQEARVKFVGKIFHSLLTKGVSLAFRGKDENSLIMRNFIKEMVSTNTLRSMATTNGGMLSKGMMEGIIDVLNGKVIRGMGKFVKAGRYNRKCDKILKKIENSAN